MYSRALIIGGTGMLADTSRWVAARAAQTILAARHPQALAAEIGAIPWEMDWQNQCSGLSTLVPMPEFDLVIAWLHQSVLWLAEHLQSKVAQGGRFVHLHASAANDPAILARRSAPPREGIFTQNVILGRVLEESHARWLTPAEINEGLIKVLQTTPKPRILLGDQG